MINLLSAKTLKTALLEVILIFIGITAAIWFDNWNEERKDRILEHNYLIELKDDMISDSISIQRVRTELNKRINAVQILLTFLETGIITDDLELKKSMIFSGYLYYFYANLSSYNELINSGNIGIISDQKLKREMDQYVNWLKQLTSRKVRSERHNYSDYYRTHYFKDGRLVRDYELKDFENMRKYIIDWTAMRKDHEFKRRVTYVLRLAHAQERWSNTSMDHISKIKTHLNLLLMQ